MPGIYFAIIIAVSFRDKFAEPREAARIIKSVSKINNGTRYFDVLFPRLCAFMIIEPNYIINILQKPY
jgi:hypothetical protein